MKITSEPQHNRAPDARIMCHVNLMKRHALRHARGIDPSAPEGAMRMHAEYNAQLANMQSPFPDFDPSYDTRGTVPSLNPGAKRKRNAKRKAARKARKKNR